MILIWVLDRLCVGQMGERRHDRTPTCYESGWYCVVGDRWDQYVGVAGHVVVACSRSHASTPLMPLDPSVPSKGSRSYQNNIKQILTYHMLGQHEGFVVLNSGWRWDALLTAEIICRWDSLHHEWRISRCVAVWRVSSGVDRVVVHVHVVVDHHCRFLNTRGNIL